MSGRKRSDVRQQIREKLTTIMVEGYNKLDRALDESQDAFMEALVEVIGELDGIFAGLVFERLKETNCGNPECFVHGQLNRPKNTQKTDEKLN